MIRRRRGLAILTSMMMIALMSVLMLALMMRSRTERIAVSLQANSLRTAQLYDQAVNFAIAKIRAGMSGYDEAGGRTIAATQPGAIRTYNQSGEFEKGYKLYTDSVESVAAEADLADDAPPVDWNSASNLARYFDLNSPAQRTSSLSFPIMDPRVGVALASPEGFSYTAGEGRVLPTSETDMNARLPMPVEWCYILRDGRTGYLDAAGKFQGTDPTVRATGDNPIVGRIAYWVDDDSCKVNTNTSAEGIFWDTLRTTGSEDRDYAKYQPTRNEYNRFSGHSAMTSLSAVLSPGLDSQPLTVAQRSTVYQNYLEPLYKWLPRVAQGGSRAATVVIDPATTDTAQLIQTDADRLFANLDEMVFDPTRASAAFTSVTKKGLGESVSKLGRWDYFLTTASRAPETTIFGTPRIPVWPVDAANRPRFFRTAFDNLVRFCAAAGVTAGGEPLTYVIHRLNADSPVTDWSDSGRDISRNRKLFAYLQALTSQNLPGYGGNFLSKWGDDRDQVLAEIVDYIRCVNLCDDNHKRLYYTNDENNSEAQTQFTNAWGLNDQTIDPEDVSNQNPTAHHHGHGQVAPLEITSGGKTSRGFGRFYTFSEAALHFICAADAGSNSDAIQMLAGGVNGTWDTSAGGDRDWVGSHRFYSNFPILDPAPTEANLASAANKPYGASFSHPGYQKANWNSALPVWKGWNTGSGLTNSTALKSGEKRVQLMLHLEAFCPAMGYNQLIEKMQVRIKGLETIRVANKEGKTELFSSDTRTYNLGGSFGSGWHGRSWGGTSGIRGIMGAQQSLGVWPNSDWPYRVANGSSTLRAELNRTLASEFFTITGPSFSFQGGTVQVEIYSGHNPGASDLVQRITLQFPSGGFPTPELCMSGTFADPGIGPNGSTGHQSTGACFTFPGYWWSFHANGSYGSQVEAESAPTSGYGIKWTNNMFYRRGRVDRVWDNPSYPWTPQNNPANIAGVGNAAPTATPRIFGQMYAPGMIRKEDTVRTLVPAYGDTRLIAALKEVPASAWAPYGRYDDTSPDSRLQHILCHSPAGSHWLPGFGGMDGTEAIPTELNSRQLVPGAAYLRAKQPDFPGNFVQRWGDFDNGISLIPDGAFINKPDEGNTHGLAGGGLPYLDGHWTVAALRPAYFSPNRIMPGPGMLGSLPTGVKRGIPWQTLLFRPAGSLAHPGALSPRDHLILDNFWMPKVEPYAISEPFSTAGKVNLNYQILPFKAITRSTALRAVLKSEKITAIPKSEASKYKLWDHELADYYVPRNAGTFGSYRHNINLNETMRQFQTRFETQKALFRSASEICDVHLVPDKAGATVEQMDTFWSEHALTGDNTRERPYTNILGRLTTRSNTFTVHVCAQTLVKARSSDPDTFDPDVDQVVAQQRGFTTIERFVDPTDTAIPDYAPSDSQPDLNTIAPLDKFYRFRVVTNRRFLP